MKQRFTSPGRLLVVIAVTALALCLSGMLSYVSPDRLIDALIDPDRSAFGEVYVHFSLVPRILVAILAGIALAFTGTIFQQLLKNPLAEPSTLGILSGAQLAITLASLSAVSLSATQREIAGLAGGLGAVALVCGLAARSGFAPITLLLSGMIVSFAAGSASVITALFHHEYLRGVFIWGSGSLIQNDYSNAVALLNRMVVLMPVLLLFARPLAIAGLDDTSARSLGISPAGLRAIVLFLATVLSALVVARVGVIAFVGLAAPNVARLSGARTFRQRLLWGSLFGATLLLFADGIVLAAAPAIGDVPTGTITALSGALIIMLMLKNVPPAAAQIIAGGSARMVNKAAHRLVLPVAVVTLALFAAFSLDEQFFSGGIDSEILLSERWPRVMTAASAGALLALAGAITQAVTGNPMASPEGLGVSGGSGLGIIAAFFLGGLASPLTPLIGGVVGAAIAFSVILVVAGRHRFSPGPVLLAGISVGALVTAIISIVVASGDPRAAYILAWTMGPTFRANSIVAIIATVLAVLALGFSPLFRRWLDVLPLGDALARSLGVRPGFARGVLLGFVATLTAAATLIVGPLSFVGLMGPHLARMAGSRASPSFVFTASAFGALLMTVADWLGRTLDFPYEIPAGVLTAFLGGPYFLWAVFRQTSLPKEKPRLL